MESTPPLQIADVIAWGRNRLESGSTHERDGVDLYATAVRTCNTIQGIHRQVGEAALSKSRFAEEGAEVFNRQRRSDGKTIDLLIFDGMMPGRHSTFVIARKPAPALRSIIGNSGLPVLDLLQV